ncbi:extensin [Neltuma alba]|uniref:extensin n=1 Tax=Neltuma alba TaxID=207710 RepID=UPI0010A58751|nr:extensin [Prosopis alba]
MDSPLSTLGFVIFGITFSIYSVIAESQSPSTSVSRPSSPPSRPQPSPPSSPHYSLPAPSYAHPPSPPPPPPPPPTHHSHSSSQPLHGSAPLNPAHAVPRRSPRHPDRSYHGSPPPASSPRMNWRKKVGLLFAGIAGIMQIGVVGFLVFKRRQLLRTKDTFEARG